LNFIQISPRKFCDRVKYSVKPALGIYGFSRRIDAFSLKHTSGKAGETGMIVVIRIFGFPIDPIRLEKHR